ncbi:hypothetical protein ACJJTC_007148 [Scirpophaga incertulas]
MFTCPLCNATIQCCNCKNNQSIVSVVTPGSSATLDLVLQELRSGINGINDRLEQLPSIVSDIKNIQENLQSLESSLSGIRLEVTEHTSKISNFENRIQALEQQSTAAANHPLLQEKITELSNELFAKNQIARLNNVEIKGCPMKKNENLFEIMSKIGNIIGQHIEKSDINFITRVRSATQPKSIIVGFLVRYKKEDFVAAARSRKPGLMANELGFIGEESRIYINDHLTKESKQLLSKTKKIAAELNYNYVWVQNCKILVRKSDNSPIITIKNDSDLSKMR